MILILSSLRFLLAMMKSSIWVDSNSIILPVENHSWGMSSQKELRLLQGNTS